MKKPTSGDGLVAAQIITDQIAELGDWRGQLLARLREMILAASPDLSEEVKWNTAVWTSNGLVCAAGAFKDHVKVNFFKGASLPDPKGMFNAGLEAKATRAIDIHEGDKIDAPALKALIRAAVTHNLSTGTQRKSIP